MSDKKKPVSNELQKQESVFRFAETVQNLLVEAKKAKAKQAAKKPLKKKDGKPDQRSPVIKEIFKNRYPKTEGLHPRDFSVLRQVRELNGKPSYQFKPLTVSKIATGSRLVKEDIETSKEPSTLETVRSVLIEWGSKSTVTSGWHRSRHGKTHAMQPGNRPERAIVKAAKHEDSSAKDLAKQKFAKVKERTEYDQAQMRRDAHIKQVSRVT